MMGSKKRGTSGFSRIMSIRTGRHKRVHAGETECFPPCISVTHFGVKFFVPALGASPGRRRTSVVDCQLSVQLDHAFKCDKSGTAHDKQSSARNAIAS